MSVGLQTYRKKRDFGLTPEPRGVVARKGKAPAFVVQQHAASHLHYDFRLEHAGVLLSWAVPKGPSLDPAQKRLAVRVEDHPVEYGAFEGVIPAGQYGAGRVIVWDNGRWDPLGDVDAGLRAGKLVFELHGHKLSGQWALVRTGGRARDPKNWLLIKHRDAAARTGAAAEITLLRTESVMTGRSIADLPAPLGRRKSRTTRVRSARPRVLARTSGRKLGRASLPTFVEPQLATLVEHAPSDDGWVFETKFDGYRMFARLDHGRVQWLSRNGRDWSERFAALTPDLAALSADSALLDGEVVVVAKDGTTSFQDLQNALGKQNGAELTYEAFDLLHIDGRDLRDEPLLERKRLLRDLLAGAHKNAAVSYSAHVEGDGTDVFVAACRASLEGIVAKRVDAPYSSGRTRSWLKLKCGLRQEFVVVGYTRPQGSRTGFGALVIGVHERGKLRYAGRVGAGFDHATLTSLHRRLAELHADAPPVAGPLTAAKRRGVTWVRPEIVVEVAFSAWTQDDLVRQPTFEGLREDKSARDVVRERARSTAQPRRAHAKETLEMKPRSALGHTVAGIAITHPERVLFAEAGLTKLDLALYYSTIAPRLLPHVVDRPLSIVRCPEGTEGACFFQKHAGPGFPAAVGSVAVREGRSTVRYLTIASLEALVALVQMGAIELHPWGSRNDRLDAPERMIFDLDPDQAVEWNDVVDAARRLRARLQQLDLDPFLAVTGGKGLHLVVPLTRRNSWDEVKAFSRSIANELARAEPERYVATASKAQRHGRIFIDYLRNARGATAVAPYSVRARPNATIATPVGWNELGANLRPDAFTIANLAKRLQALRRDPWAEFDDSRQTLAARTLRALGK